MSARNILNRSSSKRRFVLPLIAVALIAALIFVIRGALMSAVEVTLPIRGPAIQAVYATGTVEAEIMLPIATRSTAWLTNLNVDEGDQVKKGQALAELENEDLRNSLAALLAKEKFAKNEFERYSQLMERNATSRQTYESSKSEWESAQAASAQAKAQMQYMNLHAPADGQIIRRDGEVGQLIPANQAVFWLSVASPLRISAEVDEEDIALVKAGQKVVIRADAFSGRTFNGSVKSITPKGDPVARSYRVRIEFSEQTPLQIGMTAETNIVIEERQNALLIPASALDNDKVWIVNNSRTEQRTVVAGIKGTNHVEVLEGLAESEHVAVNFDAELKPGRKVETVLINQSEHSQTN